jgi:predicted O-methyltransferase YrrM
MKVMRRTEDQINGLKDLIDFMEIKGARMLEIGSYLGESARIFAESKKFSKIHCLDLWAGGYDQSDYASQNMAGVEDIFMEFKSEFPDLIVPHKNNSSEVSSLFDDGYFDFIYIDGNHTYESVESDIKACITKIKSGGYIAGHDYDYPLYSVKKVVDKIFSSPDAVFSDTSWIKKIN